MPQASEIALAKSAAPANISGGATIKVLTTSGFKVVHHGENGFLCMVLRGFAAPTYTPHNSGIWSTMRRFEHRSASILRQPKK